MRRPRTIVAVGAAAVLALGVLGLSQAGADPVPTKPLQQDTSIPAGTTEAELATSGKRMKLLDDLRTAAAAKPQRYGGVDTDGDAKTWLCDNGSSADPAADTAVAALRATGSTVTIRTCARNIAQLTNVLPEVAASSVFSSNGVTLRQWGIDYSKDAVQIGVDRIPPGFADKVNALWGDAVFLWVAPEMHLQ